MHFTAIPGFKKALLAGTRNRGRLAVSLFSTFEKTLT
jgi:hypothetical protein